MEPFWTHFGSILSPFSTRNRLFGAQSRPKSLPGGLWNAASIFIDFLAFFHLAPAAGGDAILTPAGVREPGPSFDQFSKKGCWESSPSTIFDNAPRKPQYRASFQLALREYKLACISYGPPLKRRGQHDFKRRWDRVERGAADLKGYAPCPPSPVRRGQFRQGFS